MQVLYAHTVRHDPLVAWAAAHRLKCQFLVYGVNNMIRKLFSTLLLLVLSSAASAGSCPLLMKNIDAALEDPTVAERLSDDQLAEARKLRNEGEKAHKSGDHARSMEALGQAEEILGIS
jgi:hypothetical protein